KFDIVVYITYIPYPTPFPTRRSSDLASNDPLSPATPVQAFGRGLGGSVAIYRAESDLNNGDVKTKITATGLFTASQVDVFPVGEDRKSTRLNSSHRTISYAVFCLKKR